MLQVINTESSVYFLLFRDIMDGAYIDAAHQIQYISPFCHANAKNKISRCDDKEFVPAAEPTGTVHISRIFRHFRIY